MLGKCRVSLASKPCSAVVIIIALPTLPAPVGNSPHARLPCGGLGAVTAPALSSLPGTTPPQHTHKRVYSNLRGESCVQEGYLGQKSSRSPAAPGVVCEACPLSPPLPCPLLTPLGEDDSADVNVHVRSRCSERVHPQATLQQVRSRPVPDNPLGALL